MFERFSHRWSLLARSFRTVVVTLQPLANASSSPIRYAAFLFVTALFVLTAHLAD
jgi:hypothetical protein